mgnify:FL=1
MSTKKPHIEGEEGSEHTHRTKKELHPYLRSLKEHRFATVGLVVAVIALCAVGGFAYYQSQQPGPSVVSQIVDTVTEEPVVVPEESKEIPRHIDGVIVPREEANPHLVCVMIENAAFGGVRPQSGLSKASVVYEVIVEGGITRLMAVFANDDDDKADIIGPVRSARDTYLEFAAEYNCPYAHAGGSYTAMLALRERNFRDVDGLKERGFYRRAGKVSPHNLFISWDDLQTLAGGHNWRDEAPTYTPWAFADPLDTAARPGNDATNKARTVKVGFGGSYDVEFRYNADENVYERYDGGVAHKDELTNDVIKTKNVVLYHVADGDSIEGKGRINWPVTRPEGGDVDIIHDGMVTKGKWKKGAASERVSFVDADGKDIPLTRGNTWVEVVPPHISSSIE